MSDDVCVYPSHCSFGVLKVLLAALLLKVAALRSACLKVAALLLKVLAFFEGVRFFLLWSVLLALNLFSL